MPLLLENLPVELDAVLDPVLGKRTVKRGRAMVMKVGDAEVEYDPQFRWGGAACVPAPGRVSESCALGADHLTCWVWRCRPPAPSTKNNRSRRGMH